MGGKRDLFHACSIVCTVDDCMCKGTGAQEQIVLTLCTNICLLLAVRSPPAPTTGFAYSSHRARVRSRAACSKGCYYLWRYVRNKIVCFRSIQFFRGSLVSRQPSQWEDTPVPMCSEFLAPTVLDKDLHVDYVLNVYSIARSTRRYGLLLS